MEMLRKLSLVLASLSFIVVIGGAVYEHLALVPVWAAAVPKSLSVFQGEYKLAAQNFWIPIHPVTIVLFLLALILNWGMQRRTAILIAVTGYTLVLAITAVYFVPELMALTQTAYSQTVDAELTRRAKTWETLSLIRLGWLLVLAGILLWGLIDKRPPARADGIR